MVAEQLPAPGLGFGRIAKQAKDVGPFAEHLRPADQVAEKTIEPHHVARHLVALAAQACAHHCHHRRLDCGVDLIEPKAVMLDVQLGILPVPPKLRVDGERGRAALRRGEAQQQVLHGGDHCRCRRIFCLQRKQVRLDMSVCCHPGKRALRPVSPRYRTNPWRADFASALPHAPAVSDPRCCFAPARVQKDDSRCRSCDLAGANGLEYSKCSFHKTAATHRVVLQTLVAQHHKSARHGMHDRTPEVPALVDRIAGARNQHRRARAARFRSRSTKVRSAS